MECLPRAMKDMSSSDKEANDKEDGMSRERPRKATSATSQQMIRHIDMLQRAKKLMDGQDAMDARRTKKGNSIQRQRQSLRSLPNRMLRGESPHASLPMASWE